MFTAKFYGLNGRRVIREAESFTIISGTGGYEITLHRSGSPMDIRHDLSDDEPGEFDPPRFQRLVIENANGKTTEMITTPGAVGQPF